MSWQRGWLPHAPTRWRTGVAFALALLGVATPVVSITWLSANVTEGMDRASLRTAGYMVDVTEAVATSYVREGESALGFIEHLREDGDLSGSDLESQETLIEVLVTHESINSAAYVRTNGTYVRVRRYADGFLGHVVDVPGAPFHSWTKFNAAGNVERTGYDTGATENLAQLWLLVGGASDSESAFLQPRVSELTNNLENWMVRPVRSAGALQAVLAVDINSADVSETMNSTVVAQTAKVFLLSGFGDVVAAPSEHASEVAHMAWTTGDAVSFAQISTLPPPNEVLANGDLAINHEGVIVIERDLMPTVGVPWVVHLEVEEAQLNPAMADVREWMHWSMVLRVMLFVAVLTVLVALLRPIRRLRERSETDVLTGVRNRAHFDAAVRSLDRRANRVNFKLAVVMIDLDHFKRINDESSHERGDMVLKVVAQALDDAVREDSVVFRWGGDEFVVLSPLHLGDEPRSLAKRLVEVCTLAVEAVAPEIEGIGCTAGYAVTDTSPSSVRDAVTRADVALVAGKLRGKGEVYGADQGRDALVPSTL